MTALALLIATVVVAPAIERDAAVAEVTSAMREGRDREAIVALQRLKARFPDDDDHALWQLGIVTLAATIAEQRQVNTQLALLATSLRSHGGAQALAQPFLEQWVAQLYAIGPGCFSPGPWENGADEGPRLLAQTSPDPATRAFAFFVLGELHAWRMRDGDAAAARAAYNKAVAAAPTTTWAARARACLADDLHDCGRKGNGFTPTIASTREAVASAISPTLE